MRMSVLSIGTVFLLTAGCGKFNLTPEVSINFQDPTNVTETGFQIGWSINPSDYSTLTCFLSDDPVFSNILDFREFSDPSVKSTSFSSLRGARTYYIRISLVRGPGDLFISNSKAIDLPYHQEAVSFNTADSANLKGFVYYLQSDSARRPGIIMMHEFGIFVNGWINAEIVRNLVSEQYICMVFFNRGHGSSTGITDLQQLLQNPVYLGNDLRAAIGFLEGLDRVDTDSIGLMGASMGGSMAVAGNAHPHVRTSVALSPSTLHTNSMFPGDPIRSVFYIVGENDVTDTGSGIVDFPAEALILYNQTDEPRKYLEIDNTAAHGTELLQVDGINRQIVDWFRSTIPAGDQ